MEMKGLLDFATSPMGQGLLAAGFGGLAGANRGTPINNIGRAGLAGLTGYSAASALQDQRLKREEAEKIKAAIPTLYTQGPDGSMRFDTIAAAKLGVAPDLIKGYAEAPNYGKAKVARTVDIEGPDGSKQVAQYDDYGQQVGGPLAGYMAPQLVDTGDQKQFVKPTAGQSFQMGLSPADIDASRRGWAGVAVRRDANDVLRETNNINKTATRTEVFKSNNGATYLIDKGTNEVRPLTAPDGSPLTAPTTVPKLTESEGKNTLYLSQMRSASNDLDKIEAPSPLAVAATGTPFLNWAAGDTAQRAGQSQRQWSEAYLRAKTGAAATQGEVENNIKTFFPVAGDGPDVIKQKAAAREQAMRDMEIPAGRGAEQAAPRTGAVQRFDDPDKEARYQQWLQQRGQ